MTDRGLLSVVHYPEQLMRARTEPERNMVTEQNSLIATYIEGSPARAGLDEAILIPSGTPVWAIIGAITRAGSTPEEVASDYDVPLDAVHAALAFYHEHQAVIDARIAANHSFAA